jgi:periplasmic protein TonB
MQAKDILQSDMLDIIFDDRNKEYGAYELRKKYNKRIAAALSITAMLLLLLVLSSFISKKDNETAFEGRPKHVIKITEIDKPKEIIPPPITPPPVKPKVKVEQFLPPVVVDKIDVDPPPRNSDLQNQTIDNFKREGDDPTGFNPPEPPAENLGLTDKLIDHNDYEIIFDVQEQATVDMTAWRKHLGRYLEPVIEEAAEKGMPSGTYTIQIKFLVERDGSINDVTALSDPGFGLATEAIKVVKKGPQWSPGRQNGRTVRSYHTQPITFIVPEN